MHRTELIQGLISKGKKKTYLEIGVNNGSTFFRIKCKKKIAVDPDFVFNPLKKQLWKIVNPYNLGNIFFKQESNAFFKSNAAYLNNLNGIDIVFVDGLHTFRNSLEDILNALKHLKQDGVIVVHDCYPKNEAAAMPTKTYPTKEEQNVEGWTGAWSGDVWKSIVYLKEELSDLLNISVIKSDFGLGVITLKEKIDKSLTINENSFENINKLTYKEMIADSITFLNLKEPINHEKIIEDILL